jgi:hypothetical protein
MTTVATLAIDGFFFVGPASTNDSEARDVAVYALRRRDLRSAK